ncbi:hypothetical protein [Paraburkholderia mimosarum]|uniref:hypothetical protein n=1 Tax=Paraburkholderia mimosarum TaxID=312026 RepID=UPI0004155C39
MNTRDVTALHDAMGATLVQKKDLVALGLIEDTATAYRGFMKRLAERRALCERPFYSRSRSKVCASGPTCARRWLSARSSPRTM